MSDETYNGWTNRETWAAKLWLDNDEGLYNEGLALVTEARRQVEDDDDGIRTEQGYLADAIQELFESLFDPEETPQTAELANVRNDIGSMWRVDWYEISRSLLDDNPEETGTCRHCGRPITKTGGTWVDPMASGDDESWRETCDAHDTFTAEHEPEAE